MSIIYKILITYTNRYGDECIPQNYQIKEDGVLCEE